MDALSPNAMQLLEQRYLLKKNGDLMESPEAMFQRVAEYIATAEKDNQAYWAERFFEMMSRLEFLPNSPTLMNAGLTGGQLSACFVLPIEDNLEAIFSSLTKASLIHKSGGGTGYNFSQLRPRGSDAGRSVGPASGPVGFLRVFDEATRQVKQGGKRRGANMGILNVDHPDILEFINAKGDGVSLQNFNLSVGISDRFMKAVEGGLPWELKNPFTKKVMQRVPARSIWDAIVRNAWESGDPGLIFLDAINRRNPIKNGVITSTNPCGEVPLEDFESCNLGSVNLSRMLQQEKGEVQVDWDKLRSVIHTAVRFLDNVITVNHYVLPEVKKMTLANRKIGLGVMGWAEMLIRMDIPYASEAAVQLGSDLMKFIQQESYLASGILADEKGVFPNYYKSRFFEKKKMRNATCNSIAPTGSLAIIAGTSYGIEPLYALSYTREGILGNRTQYVLEPVLLEKLKSSGLWGSRTRKLVHDTGSLAQAGWIPVEIRKCFATSQEISWEFHLRHQKAFQNYTDNAVSKTINLPEKVSPEQVEKIFRNSWEYGLKGITVYRDKSKKEQVLNKSCGLVRSTC
ncbi:adenosylcobalamin-dependent ribonucleoside-diphosphate reductase [Robertkochia marina]|uniref:Vitamin B12-dependent ribonucleotide reductase n=1 Tax=Robertkochia marina TaxID=1227945 RepID=A0A4S3LYF8_9FLAO|nr:adenosylcobalamin-dependent ribonucleoside-diphosphate reductase [Robertkochia marina]THD66602.1 adenosylcobalamin-dependent ribonucleoside-diphosphate reductase [Robertkochia marina]TRZ45559.1 adenosylcobalamin-dependent ribonucleoside-diphosphate reductase [Robertkochia marina]